MQQRVTITYVRFEQNFLGDESDTLVGVRGMRVKRMPKPFEDSCIVTVRGFVEVEGRRYPKENQHTFTEANLDAFTQAGHLIARADDEVAAGKALEVEFSVPVTDRLVFGLVRHQLLERIVDRSYFLESADEAHPIRCTFSSSFVVGEMLMAIQEALTP